MTTDDQKLTDQLWEAVVEVCDPHPRVFNDAPTDEVVAAVLPTLRRAQADAWENGRRAGFASAIDRTMPTIGPDANPYRTEQTNG